MKFRVFVVMLFLLPIVIFVAQNYAVVEIKFLMWSIKASRSIILFITLMFGVLIGWMTSSFRKGKK